MSNAALARPRPWPWHDLHLRLIGLGGAIAYRALFNWTTPAMFVGTLLAGPLFQLLFFAYLGRQLGVADDRFYIVGNAVLAASLACVFGGTMAVANERRYGTLGHVLLSPRSRTVLFLGRALPYAANGLLVAAFTLAVGALLLRLRVPRPRCPAWRWRSPPGRWRAPSSGCCSARWACGSRTSGWSRTWRWRCCCS